MPRAAASLASFALLAAAPSPAVRAGQDARASASAPERRASVRVVLVRHAEAEGDGADPGLSAAGREHAQCLARVLEAEPLSHVYASPWRRALETATALAEPRHLAVTTRDPMKADAMASEIAALPPGSCALVVGHSNTLPLLAKALGVSLTGLVEEAGQPTIPRDDHDRLVIVELPGVDGMPKLDERRQHCAAEPPAGP